MTDAPNALTVDDLRRVEAEARRIRGILRSQQIEGLRAVGIRFFHFRDLNGTIVATICAQQVGADTIRFAGVTISDAPDGVRARGASPIRLAKREGREIAYGRLLKGNSALLPVKEFEDQVHQRTILLWLGKPNPRTGMTRGHVLWAKGICAPKPRPIEIQVTAEAAQEVQS